MQTIKFRSLGIVDYKKAWDYQEQLFVKVVSSRVLTEKPHSGYLFFYEHSHVYYTTENNGQNTNLHTANFVLKCSGKAYYNTISSTNPRYLSFINPCEFVDKDVVTTMQKVQGGNAEHYDVQRVV